MNRPPVELIPVLGFGFFRVVAEDAIGHEPVVLALGQGPFETLKAKGCVPKGATLSSYRGRVIQYGNSRILVSYDPSSVWIEPRWKTEILADFRLAQRLHSLGTIEPRLGAYHWVSDLGEFAREVWDKLERDGVAWVAFDLETMGRYPWYPNKHILTSQWCHEEGRAVVVDHRASPCSGLLRDQIEWLLNEDRIKITGANLKFDFLWASVKWGIRCTNQAFDTFLGGSLLDENRSNSLSTHARVYTDLGGYDLSFNRKYNKEYMEKVPREDLLAYAAADADASYRCTFPIARRLARDRRLTNFYKVILQPGGRAFEQVERRGVVVDVPRLHRLYHEVLQEIREQTQAALKMIPVGLRGKYEEKHGKKYGKKYGGKLSLNRPALIREYLFDKWWLGLEPVILTPKTQEPSTSLEHLRRLRGAEVEQFTSHLERISQAEKVRGTFIRGFKKDLRPDGRFHPSYALAFGELYGSSQIESGTPTGRLAAKNPAIQTLPKHTRWAKKLRQCYPAPPGMLCWGIDFSQGELRVVACFSKEKRMIEAYRKGEDLHVLTPARLNGMELAHVMALKKTDPSRFEEFRFRGKAANFGLIYGMSAPGFQEYARNNYGLVLSLEEATNFREAFLNEIYPGLLAWHQRMEKIVTQRQQVRSPLGRIRRLPQARSPDPAIRWKAIRQGINSPVQSTLTDLCVLALVLLEKEFGDQEEKISVNGSTHDQLWGYVTQEDPERWVRAFAEIMGNLPIRELFGWNPQLSFPVDAEIGPTLGELEKIAI